MSRRKTWLSRTLLLTGVGVSLLFLAVVAVMVRRTDEMRQVDKSILLAPKEVSDVSKVYWDQLAELDYETGRVPAQLGQYDKVQVHVPGFAVPLEDNLDSIREFLLVPNRMACIHAPPPPPNQMVYVRLGEPQPVGNLMGPLWVEGRLRIVNTQSKYGTATYEMDADRVWAYTPE